MRRDSGAAALIVTMLFSTGLLVGIAAFTVDIGSMQSEKRQLQNAADAAALSMAATCVKAEAKCNYSGATTSLGSASITQLADSNSQDGHSGLDPSVYANGVCGSAAISTVPASLPLCNAPTSSLADCLPLPTWITSAPGPGIKYVEAHTQTLNSSGGTILPAAFGQLINGRASYTLASCSRTAWGPPGNGTAILPVTFSLCDWYLATANGTTFPATEIALTFNGANNSTCSTWAGHDFPGGFGWLTHDSTCRVFTDDDDWADAKTGLGAGNDCGPAFATMMGKTVYLPIFDCMDDNKVFCPGNTPRGTDSFYHIWGYAAFYLTAVDVTGQVRSNLPGYPTAAAQTQCASKGGKCIFGWFLGDVKTDQGDIDPTGHNAGLTVVKMAG